jgi:hypothetical protein
VKVDYLVQTLAQLLGDYNNNGAVDAADYVLWRNGSALQNDDTPGTGADDYTRWRAQFGKTLPGGSGADAAVPEPAAIAMLLIAALSLTSRTATQSGRRGETYS